MRTVTMILKCDFTAATIKDACFLGVNSTNIPTGFTLQWKVMREPKKKEKK